jgi:hypothetical protein
LPDGKSPTDSWRLQNEETSKRIKVEKEEMAEQKNDPLEGILLGMGRWISLLLDYFLVLGPT